MVRLMVYLILGVLCWMPVLAIAEANTYTVVLKDHTFTPNEIKIPANQKVILIVDNQDPTPEEFESSPLRREKVIPGNTKATLSLGPLAAGEYPFVGEFHEDKAIGKIIAE